MSQKIIKYLVIFITAFSLLSGIGYGIFPALFAQFNLAHLFGLSMWGIEHFFFWQVFTHILIYPSNGGITAGFLLQIALNMFMLWRMGNALAIQKGLKHFISIFAGAALVTGLTALAVLQIASSSDLFAGTSPAIMSLIVALVVLFPEMQIMLFLTLPMKAKWLIVGILGSILLIDLSNGFFLTFFTNLAAICYGYIYAVTAWQTPGPFFALRALDTKLMKIGQTFTKSRKKDTLSSYASGASKIYDFKTGERILKDEQFLDACLSKIANEGRSSLTLRERFRLWRISLKKARKTRAASSAKSNYEKFREE